MKNVWFFSENDDINSIILQNNDIFNKTELYNKMSLIIKKVFNNKIGYFQFKLDGEFIKICILPKIINKQDDDRVQKFIEIINKYYGIVNKYKNNILYKRISKNYLDIIFDNNIKEIDNLEQSISNKYLTILRQIENFFERYRKYEKKENQFISQNIRHKIDIKRNITEIDKCKIHQTYDEKVYYSVIADITIWALKHFRKHKLDSINENYQIKRSINKISKLINRKFNITDIKYIINQILSYKVKSNFKNSREKTLYTNILFLIGLEGYFEENKDYTIINKLQDIVYFAFNAELVFEFLYYEKLLRNLETENIKFDKLNFSECKEEFILFFIEVALDSIEPIKPTSQPEFIIYDDNNIIVKDCKWKILESIKDINEQDILKLKRDCLIRGSLKGILVYPEIKFDYKHKIFRMKDSNFEEEIFTFEIEEFNILEM